METERAEIHVELAAGVFVVSAQAFLRLGLATTVLVGKALLTGGVISLLTYLVFLVAAARIYDPLSLALQNTAATFNAMIQIERMRQIEEQPIQGGEEPARRL